jgi:hypothetical protein
MLKDIIMVEAVYRFHSFSNSSSSTKDLLCTITETFIYVKGTLRTEFAVNGIGI